MDTFGIIFFSMIMVMGWLMAVYWHKSCQSNSDDAVRLPKYVGLIFGSTRDDGILNWRGVLLQVAVYIIVPIYIQVLLGYITPTDTFNNLLWPMLILGVVALLISFWRERH